MKQERLQSNPSFVLMSLEYRIRDWLHPPAPILEHEGLRPGMAVVDYGCGPGAFAVAAAKLVGPTGCVYAIDIHPLALRSVRRAVETGSLNNVQVLSADRMADIAEEAVDVVLLHDVLHDLYWPRPVLRELHRVLKAQGILCVKDHRLKEVSLLSTVMGGGYFRFFERDHNIYKFKKIREGEVHL